MTGTSWGAIKEALPREWHAVGNPRPHPTNSDELYFIVRQPTGRGQVLYSVLVYNTATDTHRTPMPDDIGEDAYMFATSPQARAALTKFADNVRAS